MLYKRTSVTRHVSRVSSLVSRLVSLVSSLVSSGHALSISSLLKLLSADCGQFTDLPGSLCVVLKNTGCAFLTSRIVSRVFHRVISRCDCCSALCSLLCSASNCSASAARLRSRIAALFGSQLCLAGSRLFLAHGSARLDVAAALLAASALLCLRLLAAPPLARRGCSQLAALLGPCDSGFGTTGSAHGFRLSLAQLGSTGARLARGFDRVLALLGLAHGSARLRLGSASAL